LFIITETHTRFRPRPPRQPTEAEKHEQALHAAFIEAQYRTSISEDDSQTLHELRQIFPELSFDDIASALGNAARRHGRKAVLLSPFAKRLREIESERKERRR
jgi:hypothetical protein